MEDKWELKEFDIITDKGTWCKGDMLFAGRPVEINEFSKEFLIREIVNIIVRESLTSWELFNYEVNYTRQYPTVKITDEQKELGRCAGYFWLQLKLRLKRRMS